MVIIFFLLTLETLAFSLKRIECLFKGQSHQKQTKENRKDCHYLKPLHTWTFVILCLIPISVYTLEETFLKMLLRGNFKKSIFIEHHRK